MEPDNETVEDDKSEYEREDDASTGQDETDHSATAVLERESAKEDRAPYVHPEGARDYRVEGNDVRDYVGVDPEYMTYANATEAPMLTDTERYDQTTQYDHLEGNADEVSEELDGDIRDEDLLDRNYSDPGGTDRDDVTGLRWDEFNEAREEAQKRRDGETQDSEPGNAGASPDPDSKLGKESKADPEINPSGFSPFA